ncbi:GNAT family N-acetyltransferase [Pusillimonas caeni]|uniref:GNAT family N-acetyltransferase n=1 Tax=Pusillimonas caeni TaxID=1348472 RepID=UPI000E59B900|nr:GNAT family N-acetyltransferase [Pusillimonas caeni]TFL11506.1 GNAT family N-acetyltransferase [Pusillimonas caeni]
MGREIEVLIGDWGQLGERAGALRHEVFVVEQGVPVELELDEYDAIAVHALALEGDTVVGTGRLLPDAHIGRMAVRAAHRGRGVGAMLLTALVEAARRRGDPSVALAAQWHARGFYRAYGFQAEGEKFMDAGIEHISMRKVF